MNNKNGNPMFCIICGNSGHSTQYCPKYKATGENNTKRTYETVQGTCIFLEKTVCSKDPSEYGFLNLTSNYFFRKK